MRRKRIKLNKYQLKPDLIRPIWLEEEDFKSSWLNSDFCESNRLTEDQLGYHQNQKFKQKNLLKKGKKDKTRDVLPLDVVRPRIYGYLVRFRGVFAPSIFRRSPAFCIYYKYLQILSVQGAIRQRRIFRPFFILASVGFYFLFI